MIDREGTPTTDAVAAYFDSLYSRLAGSAAQRRIVGSVLGEGLGGLIGYADEDALVRVAEVAGIGRGTRVLDLCCGTGDVVRWLRARLGAKAVGVDCARLALKVAGDGCKGCLVAADVDGLPFASGSLDAVVAVDGFSYRPRSMLRECARVLRRRGRMALLLSLPSSAGAESAEMVGEAGFSSAAVEDVTGDALPLLRRLDAAYWNGAREHIAEVGERYHRALAGEVRMLIDKYERGLTVRMLLAAER